MPFKDPDVSREYHRNLHNEKYWTNPEFREYDRKRKAEWFQKNKEKAAKRLREWRAKRRKEGKPIAAPRIEKPKLLRLDQRELERIKA